MVKKVIYPGSGVATGDGDALRVAAIASNDNLAELYARGGDNNARNGTWAAILGGTDNTVTGDRSFIGGGQGNVVGGPRCFVPGGAEAVTNRYGSVAWSAGKISVAGDAQAGITVLRRQVTGNSPTWLTADGAAEAATNLCNMADHDMLAGRYTVIAKQVGSQAMAVWRLNVALVRDQGVASIVIISGRAQGAAPDASVGNGANWKLDTWNNTVLGSMGNWFTGSAGATVNVVGKLSIIETITQPMTIGGGGGTTPPQTSGVNFGFSTPFGDFYWNNRTLSLDECAAIGCQHLRVDYWWNEIEYNSGSFNWSERDTFVTEALARGIAVVGILLGTPGWAASQGGMNNATVRQRYAEFCQAAAARYAGRVLAWELGNEYNAVDFWGGSPNISNYCDAVRRAYPLIKAADPASIVITAGPASSPETVEGNRISAPDWFRGLYDYGAKGYFDMVGVHPYTYPYYPYERNGWSGWLFMTDILRPRMEAEGDGNKKVWISEFGAPTASGSPDGSHPANKWGMTGNNVPESVQAEHVQQSYDLSVSYGWVAGLSIYTWQDRGGDVYEQENYFGVIRPDRSRKPAYTTFKNIRGK